jgi:18S rRNA (adenine1779-N6/adenine1780-N6)-dimethyltransferase
MIFKLLSLPNPPRTSILMVQREFALRLIARPGDPLYSRLSVNARYFARVSHVMKVGKQNFVPSPKVESGVVRIENKIPRPAISWEEWDGMLRICFLRKHKTLHALWTASKVRAIVEHNWIMHVSSHGEAVCEADLALLLSEQPQMQCDELGNDDVELGDLSEDEEGHLLNGRPVIASKSSALVTIGGHRVPRGKVAVLISLKIRRVPK